MNSSIRRYAGGGVRAVACPEACLESAEFFAININPEAPFIMTGPHLYSVQRLRRSHT